MQCCEYICFHFCGLWLHYSSSCLLMCAMLVHYCLFNIHSTAWVQRKINIYVHLPSYPCSAVNHRRLHARALEGNARVEISPGRHYLIIKGDRDPSDLINPKVNSSRTIRRMRTILNGYISLRALLYVNYARRRLTTPTAKHLLTRTVGAAYWRSRPWLYIAYNRYFQRQTSMSLPTATETLLGDVTQSANAAVRSEVCERAK